MPLTQQQIDSVNAELERLEKARATAKAARVDLEKATAADRAAVEAVKAREAAVDRLLNGIRNDPAAGAARPG